MKKNIKIYKNENGQALVLFALLIVIFIGFAALAIDFGGAYLTKVKMQNAADAAALAGVKDLSTSNIAAIKTAINYAGKNNIDVPDNPTITGSPATYTTNEYTIKVSSPYASHSDQIEVVCTKNVQYAFAKIFGFTSNDVSARAVAQIIPGIPAAFGYAIFSESGTDPLYVGKAGQSNCTGNIHTNNALHLGKHLNVTRVEACYGIDQTGSNTIGSEDSKSSNIPIPSDFKAALLAQVKSAPIKYTGNKTFAGNGIDLNQSVYVDGNVTITGNNISGKGFIYATGDINISGNNTQIGSTSNPVFIYSEGNITISGNNDNMYCVIYAPNGTIDVQKNNWTLNGRLIAKSFADTCLKNNFNITTSSNDFGGVPLVNEKVKLIE